MVLRTSNGAPFIVLAPPTLLRTGIRVEVYDRDNPGTLLAVLSETRNREWLEELNAPGSGAFDIHDLDGKLEADPTLLTYGNVIRFYLDGVLRAGFRVEAIDRIQANEEDDAGRWLKVSGRGPMGILEDAIVYPAGGVGGAPDPRSYVNDTSGLIIRELIAEAQARGTTLEGVTTDFTDTDDSFNAPFITELTLDEDIGGDLLRVAGRHTAMAADVWMTPQLVLRYANVRGIDRSIQLPSVGPTILQLGRSISELSNAEVGRITNTVLIKTPAGFLERIDAASLGLFNRREGFLSLGNVSDGATIDKTTDALFVELADPRASSTLELIPAPGATPYADFEVGDWVLAPNVNGELTRQRVRALSVTETEDGRVRYVPELATIEDELEASLERWLASSSKGTLGGSAHKVAEPNALDSQGTTTIVEGEIADHLAGQPHHDELGDLTDVDISGGALADDHLIFDGADWIPSAFAGGGGAGGPSAFMADSDVVTEVNGSVAVATASYHTVLEVASGGVELLGGAIYGPVLHGMRVTIDGTEVFDHSGTVEYGTTVEEEENFQVIDLPAMLATTSLKIELRNGSGITRTYGWRLWHRPLGGGPAGVTANLEDSTPLSSDGDAFAGGSLDGAWTETLDASVSSAHSRGAWRASIDLPAGAAASRNAAISKSITIGVGDSIIACHELAALGNEQFSTQFQMENGALYTGVRVIHETDGGADNHHRIETVFDSGGGFTVGYAERVLITSRRFWLAVKLEAANTFGYHFSLDGELWTPVDTGRAVTLSPNALRIYGAAGWNLGGPGQGAVHFFDVVTTI